MKSLLELSSFTCSTNGHELMRGLFCQEVQRAGALASEQTAAQWAPVILSFSGNLISMDDYAMDGQQCCSFQNKLTKSPLYTTSNTS